MPRKSTRAEEIAKMPYLELSKIKGDDNGLKVLRGYLKTLRSGYSRRVASFNKRGVYSYAQDSLESTLPEEVRSVKLTKLNRNQLLYQIAAYSKFFNDKTSSLKGIKKVNNEQDKRIFGKDRRDRPLRTMTDSERREFWRLYNEFKNAYPKWTTQPFSETTQQLIAGAMFGGEVEDIRNIDFAERLVLLDMLMQSQLDTYDIGDAPNVYRGRGPIIE